MSQEYMIRDKNGVLRDITDLDGFPVNLYINDNGSWRPATPSDLSGGGGGSNPTWSGVGNILSGTVAQGEEKLIDVSGATAVWIQASPDNTEPLLVSNIAGFEGAWVAPGSSEWFYYPTLYVKHNATESQGIAYQGVKYG